MNTPANVLVSLGDLYASPCAVCGCNAYYGFASTHGPAGCIEAVKAGQVYCERHIRNRLPGYKPVTTESSVGFEPTT